MEWSAIVLMCLLVTYTTGVWSVPVDESGGKATAPHGAGANVEEKAEPSKEDSTKFTFQLPPYLMGARPAGPSASGNANTQGDVQGLFALNENSLFVMSGPNSNAVANLSSTAAYIAQPYNDTISVVENGETVSQNVAGFAVTAEETSHASAEGEYIHYVNHGASFATGWGESAADGTTHNNGPEGTGSGWKRPGPKDHDNNTKL